MRFFDLVTSHSKDSTGEILGKGDQVHIFQVVVIPYTCKDIVHLSHVLSLDSGVIPVREAWLYLSTVTKKDSPLPWLPLTVTPA